MSETIRLEQIQNFEGKYPKQLWSLFFSEMWERFCFYGMRGMLIYFMVNQLAMDEFDANLQYGATQAFVYAFTFIGGLFADKILGFRKSLFWGGLLMITGSLILSFDPKTYFFLGLSFNIIGTGFFKPNISTMVGALYKEGDSRRDAGFSLFYSGINIGALLGGYVCITIGKQYSWNLAFGLAAIVMTLSLLTFLFTRKSLGPIGLSPFAKLNDGKNRQWYDYAVYVGSLAIIPIIMIMVAKTAYTDMFMYIIGPFSLVYLGYEMTKYSISEVKKLIAALLFILFSVVFWSIFEQAGGSLSLFASNNLDNKFLGFIPLDPNGVNNASNSLFVIIFAPFIGILWIWLSKRKAEPNAIVKFGMAFLFLGLAYLTFYALRFFANDLGIASLDVFIAAYFIATLAELCLSPIGLSIMTKLSPAPLQGLMMGMWFLASAYGQYVAGLFGASIVSDVQNPSALDKLISYTDGYKQFGIYALICGLILLAISPMIKKLMQEVK